MEFEILSAQQKELRKILENVFTKRHSLLKHLLNVKHHVP